MYTRIAPTLLEQIIFSVKSYLVQDATHAFMRGCGKCDKHFNEMSILLVHCAIDDVAFFKRCCCGLTRAVNTNEKTINAAVYFVCYFKNAVASTAALHL